MKTKNSKIKIILISLAVLVSVTFGAIYYAASQISPEDIKKVALEKIQEAFPKADVKLGKVELGVGLSIKVKIESLGLTYPQGRRSYDLAALKNLEVKVPVFAILFGGGNVTIAVDSPRINYAEIGSSNNWELAAKKDARAVKVKKETKTVKGESDSSDAGSVALPSFLAGAGVDVDIRNIIISYALKDKTSGSLNISKFLVNNLNFKSDSSFEVASNIELMLAANEELTLDAQVDGKFNLKHYLDDKNFKTSIDIVLANITIPNKKTPIEKISTRVNILLNEKGELSGDLLTSFLKRNKISAKFGVKGKKTSLSNLNVSLFVKDLLKLADLSDERIVAGNSQVKLNGDIGIHSKGKTSKKSVNLRFSVSPPIIVKQGVAELKTSVNGSYTQNKYAISTKSELLDGTVKTNLFGYFDPNAKVDMKTLRPFTLSVMLNDFNITRDFIQKTVYPKKTQAQIEVDKKTKAADIAAKKSQKKAKTAPVPFIPKGKIILSWNKVKVDNELTEGTGKVLVRGNRIAVDKLNFKYSKGTGAINTVTEILKDRMSHKLDLKFNKVNLDAFKAFLPPKMLESIAGEFNGSIKGTASTFNDERLTHDLIVDVKAQRGEIKGVNLRGFVEDLGKKYKQVNKFIAKVPNDGKFKLLNLNSHLRHDNYHLKSFKFLSGNESTQLTGNGNIYPLSKTKKGLVYADFVDKKYASKFLKKEIGTEILPLKLTGIGLSLTPDSSYTVKKLAKGAAKQQVKKQAKKQINKFLNKKGKGKLNDLFKKKGGKLFKGLFN